MEKIIKNCKKCNHHEFYFDEKIFSNGTKHIAQHCRQCNTFQKYVPQNNPIEVMYLGKYKGQKINDIDKSYCTYFYNGLISGRIIIKNPEKLIEALKKRLSL